MDFNVSTIKDKKTESKINACMASIKDIINDYKPIEDPTLDYGIFEYAGEVTGNTKVALEGKLPTEDVEVMGMTAGLSVHAGKLTKDGKFIGRDILFKDYRKTTTISSTIWDLGEFTSSTKPTEGKTKKDKIVIPGYPPIITGTNYFKLDDKIYTSEDKEEVLLKVSTNDLTVEVKVKDTDVYNKGITLNTVYSAFQEKTNVIKIAGRESVDVPDTWTYIIARTEHSDTLFVELADTPFARLLFDEKSFNVKKYGKNDLTINYSKDSTTTEVDDVKTVTTTTIQPYESIIDVHRNEADTEWVYTKQYIKEETIVVETWTTNRILNVYIKQYYI